MCESRRRLSFQSAAGSALSRLVPLLLALFLTACVQPLGQVSTRTSPSAQPAGSALSPPAPTRATDAVGSDVVRLALADFPPRDTPYSVGPGLFWLVHTPARRLFAFSPVAPDYRTEIQVDECLFIWEEPNRRFVDPCSGDKWGLDGRLLADDSPELWTGRDLDRHPLTLRDGTIDVYPDQLIPGTPHADPGSANDP